MQSELSKVELAKLYREFSRQRYNKYRHQFPRMRESELVAKIIKEWEGLTSNEKEQLYKTYVAEKHIKEDREEKQDSSESSQNQKKVSPGSRQSKQKDVKSSSKGRTMGDLSGTPSKKAVRVFVQSSSSKKQGEKSESSDFARDGAKKDFQISESDSKEIGTQLGKKKRIMKESGQPRTQYLKFFKFYFDKLSKEHSRWTSNQITTIIKLLWKKKQASEKTAIRSKLRVPIQRKRISGRLAFRRHFGYSGLQAAQRWKQLPFETKKYWAIQGLGNNFGDRRIVSSAIQFRRQRKASGASSQNAELGFLRKNII